jgi:ABC-type glycerol-3-phosphate transport system substrate-binding protein
MTGVAAMQAVADAFNEQSEGIFVEVLEVENVHEKYLTAIAGGAPPDVEIGNLNYSEFWARGVLLQLDDWLESSPEIDLKDIVQAALDGAKWQGKTYGVPCIESSTRFAFSYNAKLVEDAGLDPNSPPQTWDEAFEWHKATTKFDSAGNIEILGFDPMDAMGGSGPGPPDPFFWPPSFGLEWWNSAENTFHFDDDRFVAILTTIKQFYDHAGVEKMAGYRSSYGTWTQSPTASFPAQVQAISSMAPGSQESWLAPRPKGNSCTRGAPRPKIEGVLSSSRVGATTAAFRKVPSIRRKPSSSWNSAPRTKYRTSSSIRPVGWGHGFRGTRSSMSASMKASTSTSRASRKPMSCGPRKVALSQASLGTSGQLPSTL